MNLAKNFTQGGQVTLHNLRMIRQVLNVTFGTTFLLTFLFFSFKIWYDYSPYQKQTALNYIVARYKIGLPFKGSENQTQNYIHEDGSQQRIRSIDVLQHPWMQNQMSLLGEKFHHTLLVMLGFFTLIFSGMLGFWFWRGKAKAEKEILSGTLEVSQKKLINLLESKKVASPFRLGKLPLLRDSETKHILFSGTTGAGKTNTFNELLPQIRHQKQRAIIVDTTGAFVEKFYNPKTDIILNPLDARSKNWNIWQECQNDLHIDELATSLITSTLHDPFWTDAARTLFSETLKILCREKNFSLKRALNFAISLPLKDIQDFYEGTPAAALIDKAADKTAASIRVNLATYLKSLFLLEDHSQGFSLRHWVQNEKAAGWVFLLAIPEQRETLRPLLTTWLNTSFNALMATRPNPTRRLWFIMDEMASLNKIEALPKALAEIRKYGGCIVTGIQNISQIDKIYGHEIRKTMMSLYNTKLFFRSPDADTAQWISKTLGENEIIENSEGISYGAHQMRDGVSLNEQRKFKPVIPYTEFMSLPDLTAYIKLPENYPITKIKFAYQELVTRNMAFVPKVIKGEVSTVNGDINE